MIGNNHKITNMYTEVYEGHEFVSFISLIRNSSIKNLTVEGTIILDGHDDNGNDTAGSGIIGVSYGRCKIINCHNKVNVTKRTSGREVAGVLGAVEGDGDIKIEKSSNTGTIEGANAAGGVVGTVYGKVTINECYNQGELGSFNTSYVAGIVARSNTQNDISSAKSVVIKNSYNSGNIKTKRRAGGILAFCSSGTLTINNSYNTGEIKVENADATSYLGGIVGRVQQPTEKCIIANSYNISNINSVKQKKQIVVGGVLGENFCNDTTMINCYNTGNMNADYASGLIGLTSGTATVNSFEKIINSYNTGNCTGRIYSSGITRLHGNYSNADVKNVYYLKFDNLVGVQNAQTDFSTALSEEYMKSEDFQKELNSNIENIDIDISLNNWKYSNEKYPTF